MATEILRVSIKDYKKNIDELKATLLSLDRESEEYAKTLEELRRKQEKYNQVNADAKKAVDGLDGSYNALVYEMGELKKAWKSTNDEATRNEIGKQIDLINSQLKEMDMSIGNYQRNVGNYEGATKSLKQELRELNTAMAEMLSKGVKETDPAFVNLAQRAGKLKDAMDDAKAATRQYADDVRGMSVATDVLHNLGAAYGTITSGLHLFGVEMGTAQEITAKMTSVMTLLNSVSLINKTINDSSSPTRKLLITLWQQLTGAKQQDVIVTAESTVAENAHTVATNAASVAMEGEAAATVVATTATKAFRKALISTGIGAIVVALGMLIANLKEVSEWFEKNINWIKLFTGAQGQMLAQTVELKEKMEEMNASSVRNTQVMEKYNTALDGVASTIGKNVVQFSKLKGAWKSLNNEAEKRKFIKQHREEMQKLGIAVSDVNSAEKIFGKNSKDIVNGFMARAKAAAAEALMAEALADYYKALQTMDIEKAAAAGQKRAAAMKLLAESTAAAARAQKNLNDEGVKFNNGSTPTTSSGGKDTTTATEDPKVAKEKERIAKAQEELNKALRNYNIQLREIEKEKKLYEIFGEDKAVERLSDSEKKLREDLGDTFTKWEARSVAAFQYYAMEVQHTYANLINNGNLTGERLAKITEEWNKKRIELEDKYADQSNKLELNRLEKDIQTRRQTIEARIADTEFLMDFWSHKIEEMYKNDPPEATFLQKFLGITPDNLDEGMSAVRKFRMDMLSDLISLNEELLNEIDPTTRAYEEQYQTVLKLEQAYNDLADEQERATEINKKTLNKQTADYQKWASSISNLFNAVASVQQAEIDRKVKSGKISEEEAKKEFERQKKTQIAAAVVSTLAGATAAYMKDVQTYTPPASYILAGIDMATTLAAGLANIQQIRNQEYGGSGALNASSTVGGQRLATAPLLNPTLDALSLQNIQVGQMNNLNGNIGNQRVYILQSDLEASHRQVEVRQQNVTF